MLAPGTASSLVLVHHKKDLEIVAQDTIALLALK